MNIIIEIIEKLLSTPEIAAQIKNNLVNRDLAIELDGKRYQITKRKTDDDQTIEKLKSKLWDLKEIIQEAYDRIDNPDELIRYLKASKKKIDHIR